MGSLVDFLATSMMGGLQHVENCLRWRAGIQVMVVVDKIPTLMIEGFVTRLVLLVLVKHFGIGVPAHSFVLFAVIDRTVSSSP